MPEDLVSEFEEVVAEKVAKTAEPLFIEDVPPISTNEIQNLENIRANIEEHVEILVQVPESIQVQVPEPAQVQVHDLQPRISQRARKPTYRNGDDYIVYLQETEFFFRKTMIL